MIMNSKKLAIILPGTGYHKDKPLLYYATKLAIQAGYDIQHVNYLEFFEDINYWAPEMAEAADKAFAKAEKVLGALDFSQYTDVVFIGKSFGTVVASIYVEEHKLSASQIWYTPVIETFDHPSKDVIAFTGTKDPIADTELLREKADKFDIPLHIYEDVNHSLETGDAIKDLETLQAVMQITKEKLS